MRPREIEQPRQLAGKTVEREMRAYPLPAGQRRRGPHDGCSMGSRLVRGVPRRPRIHQSGGRGHSAKESAGQRAAKVAIAACGVPPLAKNP